MSRYIDVEWLKGRVHNVTLANGALHGCIDKLDIHEAPSIDIVRCGECIYWKNSLCQAWHRVIPKDGYCSIGEREGE